LYAQPIVSLGTDPIPRHELLLRMLSESGELILPASFIGVAERTDLIGELDRWVITQAAELLGAAQADGHQIHLNVNVSARTLVDSGLLEDVRRSLAEAGAAGSGLCLEVTETAAIRNAAGAAGLGAELAGLGCELALDDFGSGFASFRRLKHLHFDHVKIDGEFIAGFASDPADRLVVQAIVALARSMGKLTVAEFVGDQATLELLREYGVDYAQGFHIAPPLPLAEVDLVRGTPLLRTKPQSQAGIGRIRPTTAVHKLPS